MDYQKINKQRIYIFAGLLVICFICSCMLGRYIIHPWTVFKVLLSKLISISPEWPTAAETVLFEIRLPRVFMGCLIGAGLACSGCAYQSTFQNPIVSPDILGASNGAGFGAALGIYLGFGYQGISICALFAGLAAVGLVCLILLKFRGNRILGLVLTGIMVGAIGAAGTAYIKLIADTHDQLPAITYWLMGSLASIRKQDVLLAAPIILAGMVPLVLLRWRINVLTMGDDEARSMGVNAKQLRGIVILCATLVTAACVSVSGVIGWVGLVIPHIARILVGSDCRRAMPASMLLGGSFLMFVDNFARLLASNEIPIGILTAFISAPFFIYLILKEGNRL